MGHAVRWLCIAILLGGCAPVKKPVATLVKEEIAANAANKKALLAWDEPINSTKFGLAANKNIDGKTLAAVVSSQFSGRDDAQLCSACHNSSEAQGGYSVPALKNAASPNLKPGNLVGNRTWMGRDGWAERFVKNPTKPANIKTLVQAWINNGYK